MASSRGSAYRRYRGASARAQPVVERGARRSAHASLVSGVRCVAAQGRSHYEQPAPVCRLTDRFSSANLAASIGLLQEGGTKLSVEKGRTGGYVVRWRDSAGRQRSRHIARYKDAHAFDGELKRKKAIGELAQHDRGSVDLSDFFELWVARYGVTLTERTLSNYTTLFRKHIEPVLGSCPLRDVARADIAHLLSELARTLAPGSVRKIAAVLSCVLGRAAEWDYIRSNPCAAVRKPRPQPREGRALTTAQIDALAEALDPRGAAVVRMLAGTGLRPGELRALRWIDVADDHLLIERAATPQGIGPTKTHGRRKVILRDEARVVLDGLAHIAEFVFPAVGGGVWTHDGWRMWQRKTFAAAAERVGLAGVRPYDLRHTFVSRLIAEGRDIYWIARQAGHSPTVALSTYGHLLEA